MIYRTLLCAAVATLLGSYPPSVALAHDAEPRLEISADRLNPGGVLELRGVGFEPETGVQLSLMGPGFEMPMGETSSDVQGEFSQIVTLPSDLTEGSYYIRAVSGDDAVTSPLLMVRGSAVIGEAQDGAVGENDPLLAPMPTSAPGTQASPPGPTVPAPR